MQRLRLDHGPQRRLLQMPELRFHERLFVTAERNSSLAAGVSVWGEGTLAQHESALTEVQIENAKFKMQRGELLNSEFSILNFAER